MTKSIEAKINKLRSVKDVVKRFSKKDKERREREK